MQFAAIPARYVGFTHMLLEPGTYARFSIVIVMLPIGLLLRFGFDRFKSKEVNRVIEDALSDDGLPDDTRQRLQSLISREKPVTENRVKRWWRRVTGVRLQWPN